MGFGVAAAAAKGLHPGAATEALGDSACPGRG